MEIHEIKIAAGNAAWLVWLQLPDPKMPYMEWYYGRRKQSLSEALEGVIINNQQEKRGGESCL